MPLKGRFTNIHYYYYSSLLSKQDRRKRSLVLGLSFLGDNYIVTGHIMDGLSLRSLGLGVG